MMAVSSPHSSRCLKTCSITPSLPISSNPLEERRTRQSKGQGGKARCSSLPQLSSNSRDREFITTVQQRKQHIHVNDTLAVKTNEHEKFRSCDTRKKTQASNTGKNHQLPHKTSTMVTQHVPLHMSPIILLDSNPNCTGSHEHASLYATNRRTMNTYQTQHWHALACHRVMCIGIRDATHQSCQAWERHSTGKGCHQRYSSS